MRKLSGQLLAWLFLAFAIVFTVGLFCDGLLLRPHLRQQQAAQDHAEVRLIQSEISVKLAELKLYVRQLASQQGSRPPDAGYLETAQALAIDGMHFIDHSNRLGFTQMLSDAGRRVQSTRYFEQQLISYLMPVLALDPLPAAGMVNTPVGPALFAIASKDSGNWVVWRLWDEQLRLALEPDQRRLTARWLYADDTPKALRRAAAGLPPLDQRTFLRDAGDDGAVIRWTENDIQDQPLLLLQLGQLADNRSSALIFPSTLWIIAAAAVALLFVWFMLNRHYHRPLHLLVERFRRVADEREFTIQLSDIGNSGLRPLMYEGGRLVTLLNQMDQSLIKSNRRVEQLSKTDNLTGLGNRNYFEEFLAREWERARQLKRRITLALCDLDSLASYNQEHGHNQGDVALKQIGLVLEDNVHRATDLVARYGGEEFIVVLTDTDVEGSEVVMGKLLQAVQQLNLSISDPLSPGYLSISIGAICIQPTSAISNFGTLLSQLDSQLKLAKEAKGNCWRLSDQPPTTWR